ncbi:MAG TPA: helix-turn-helix transcriptional regulator [Virgibacillus sp.]|nr:helix-turn-helix transcriptional regulator [Virgibacillus sp.]
MDVKQIGRRIKGFRKLKGYTQEQFAIKIQTSPYLLGNIERGKKEPSEAMLETMCDVLQVSREELIVSDDMEKE